jgi:GTP cyclohydrolase-4
MATAYLGLGSNLGDREENLVMALELISEQAIVELLSSIYETEPVGFKEQPLFLNAACLISTSFSPVQLLKLAKEIESSLGREISFPNAPRPIDIDILLYENIVINKAHLTIPHPHLAQRAFVLVPLTEIAAEVVHPESKRTIKQLRDSLESLDGVRKWADRSEFNFTARRHHVSGIG